MIASDNTQVVKFFGLWMEFFGERNSLVVDFMASWRREIYSLIHGEVSAIPHSGPTLIADTRPVFLTPRRFHLRTMIWKKLLILSQSRPLHGCFAFVWLTETSC